MSTQNRIKFTNPEINRVLDEAFATAEQAKADAGEDSEHYLRCRKDYWDLRGQLEYAYEQGRIKGAKEAIAKRGKQMGLSTEDIAKLTGLSPSEIIDL